MSDQPRVVYPPRPDATPESELEVLAACYRFILECTERREKAAEGSGGEDSGKEVSNAPANGIIRETG